MPLPRCFIILKNSWMKVSHFIGRVMSFILLTVLWIIMFGLYSIIWKITSLFKKSPYTTHWKPSPTTDAGHLK